MVDMIFLLIFRICDGFNDTADGALYINNILLKYWGGVGIATLGGDIGNILLKYWGGVGIAALGGDIGNILLKYYGLDGIIWYGTNHGFWSRYLLFIYSFGVWYMVYLWYIYIVYMLYIICFIIYFICSLCLWLSGEQPVMQVLWFEPLHKQYSFICYVYLSVILCVCN